MTNVEAAVSAVPEPASAASVLAAAREGDAEAFAELLRPLHAGGHRIAAAILLDSAEAEDALQDATARAWRKLGQLQDPERLDAWFYAIVANESRRRLASPWRRVLVRGLHLNASRPIRDAVNGRDISEAVRRALLDLAVEHRTVLVLRHYHDLRVEDIAAQLALPVGTVKSRLSRGSERLRILLAGLEVNP